VIRSDILALVILYALLAFLMLALTAHWPRWVVSAFATGGPAPLARSPCQVPGRRSIIFKVTSTLPAAESTQYRR